MTTDKLIHLKNTITTLPIRQSALISGSTVINGLLGLVYYLYIARILSIGDFGYFSFLLALGILAADLGDWGISPALIKFGGSQTLAPIFSLGLVQRIIVTLVLLVLAIIGQVFYPANFLLSAEVAIFLLFLSLITQSLLAKQKYFFYSLTNIFGNTSRLVLIIALNYFKLLDKETSLGAFIFANFLAIVFGFTLLKKSSKEPLLNFSDFKHTLIEVFPFSLFSALSFGLSALAAKLDNPLVFFLSSGFQAGLYSTSQKLSSIFSQIIASLDSIFAPKYSTENLEPTNRSNLGHFLVLASILSCGIILLIPFTPLLINIFSPKYLPAVPTFQLLLLGMSLFSLTSPFSGAVLYHFGQSKANFISAAIQLTLVVSLYFLLLPRFGAYGAAITFVISCFINLIYYLFIYIRLRKNVKK